MKILYKLYHDWHIELADIEPKAKMYGGRRLTSLSHLLFETEADIPKEVIKKAREYNKLVDEIKALQKKATELGYSIFNSK